MLQSPKGLSVRSQKPRNASLPKRSPSTLPQKHMSQTNDNFEAWKPKQPKFNYLDLQLLNYIAPINQKIKKKKKKGPQTFTKKNTNQKYIMHISISTITLTPLPLFPLPLPQPPSHPNPFFPQLSWSISL